MIRLRHSGIRWKLRCIIDSSDEDAPSPSDENTPPNLLSGSQQGSWRCAKGSDDVPSTSETAKLPHWSPQRHCRSKIIVNSLSTPEKPSSSNGHTSLATSPMMILETPVRASTRTITSNTNLPRCQGRQKRRDSAAPYSRQHSASRPTKSPHEPAQSEVDLAPLAQKQASRPGDTFMPARWPYSVAHLRDQFNPLATVFPKVQHAGSCNCWDPCRSSTCRNALMHVFCSVNCCPYSGKCGNGLEDSTKVFLGRNLRTRELGIVASEDIDAGEVLGQYLGEIEHVSVSRSKRPRNRGYRLVLKQRPEKPTHGVCAAINAERMGSLMRFVNHSCRPAAVFVELSNGRRTTVVVVTTRNIHRGEEVTVDYGDDLWFVCRCDVPECRHSNIQHEHDP